MYRYAGFVLLFLLLVPGGIPYAYENGDLIDYSKVRLLRYTGDRPPGTYEAYMAGRDDRPFYVQQIPLSDKAGSRNALGPPDDTERIIVLVNADIRGDIQTELDRYIADIGNYHGYSIELYEQSGGTVQDLRAFFQSNAANLVGSVFVGDIIAAWYEIANDFDYYGYTTFPIDLYFMDLDGDWTDADADGRYDSHSAGAGDEGPEIFIGRIDTSMMVGNEIDLLKQYFDKNHDFWTEDLTGPYFGLTYTEDDWADYYDMRNDIRFAYPQYEVIAAPDTRGDDYITNRVPAPRYEFIQLACHSGSTVHAFTRGGYVYSSEVIDAVPGAFFYNLFCCSGSRYTDTNFLGGAYIYNASTSSLATIGSTKTGSMLVFHEFYKPLGQNKCFGQAFKEWFEAMQPYSFSEICWHYGMTVAGDPMLMVRKPVGETAILAGAGPGPECESRIQGYLADGTWNGATDFQAFATENYYGVQMAAGDLLKDGNNEIIAGMGPATGCQAQVKAFHMDGRPVSGCNILAYGTSNWGVNVAAGDIDGDGAMEIITGPGPGPSLPSHVRAWKYQNGALEPMLRVNFISQGARYGVQVAAGDIDGDGFDEILTGAGPGPANGPHVRAFNYDGTSVSPIMDVNFFAYAYRAFGVNVAAGNVLHQSYADIITAPGRGPAYGPHIRGFQYDTNAVHPIQGISYFAYNPGLKYGATVHCGDFNNDGAGDEILTGPGPGPGYGPHVRVWGYESDSVYPMLSFSAFPGHGYKHGVTAADGI